MKSLAPREWICPRCGSVFGAPQTRNAPWNKDSRPPWERFLHHAQRDHDMDECEVTELMGPTVEHQIDDSGEINAH